MKGLWVKLLKHRRAYCLPYSQIIDMVKWQSLTTRNINTNYILQQREKPERLKSTASNVEIGQWRNTVEYTQTHTHTDKYMHT